MEQFIQEQLIELHKQGAATQQSVSDLVIRFDKVAGWMEKLDNKISLKADESDHKDLVEKHTELDKRVTWIRASSAAISSAVSLIILGLTAWWTKGH